MTNKRTAQKRQSGTGKQKGKESYRSPRLSRYGALKDLTTASGSQITDGYGTQQTAC